MLKKELAELLKNMKDDDSIDETISKSDLGKALVNSGLTMDNFKTKLNEPDFKSFMDSEKDKHSKKAFETFKTNGNLDKLVNEEYEKRHPEDKKENSAELEAREAKAEVIKLRQDLLKEKLTTKAFNLATEKGLEPNLNKYISIGEDEETTKNNVIEFCNDIAIHDEAIKTKLLKGNSYIPPAGGASGGINPYAKETFSLTKQAELEKNDPEKAKTLRDLVNKI